MHRAGRKSLQIDVHLVTSPRERAGRQQATPSSSPWTQTKAPVGWPLQRGRPLHRTLHPCRVLPTNGSLCLTRKHKKAEEEQPGEKGFMQNNSQRIAVCRHRDVAQRVVFWSFCSLDSAPGQGRWPGGGWE